MRAQVPTWYPHHGASQPHPLARRPQPFKALGGGCLVSAHRARAARNHLGELEPYKTGKGEPHLVRVLRRVVFFCDARTDTLSHARPETPRAERHASSSGSSDTTTDRRTDRRASTLASCNQLHLCKCACLTTLTKALLGHGNSYV